MATFSISSHSDLGGPTAPGELPIDEAIAAGTSGLLLEGSQYHPDTPEDPELYYLPVAGTGGYLWNATINVNSVIQDW